VVTGANWGIARDDEEAEAELEALALEGPDSGPSIEGSAQYWGAKRSQLEKSYRNRAVS